MIHISQEELFRKIKTEHDCNNLDKPKPGRRREPDDEHEERAPREREEHQQDPQPQQDSALAAEAIAVARKLSATGLRGASEMSSLLASSNNSSKAPIRDRNNNDLSSRTTARNSSEDDAPSTVVAPLTGTSNSHQIAPAPTIVGPEDEVQAVLITGCGSKIGRNIAVAFAAQGLKVALVDFDIKQTEAVAQECQEKSPKNRVPLQIVADMSQLAEAHKVIDRTIEAFGRLDVLVNTVNNASLMEAKFNASGDDDPHVFEQYHKIIANNMHSVTYLCISAAPYLRKTKGSIVNVSSITNNETGSYKFAYCMSKAGISTLTKCLATDLAPDIKVICVSPKSDAT